MVIPIWLENLLVIYCLIQFIVTLMTGLFVWILFNDGDNLLKAFVTVGKSFFWPVFFAIAIHRYFRSDRFKREWRELVSANEPAQQAKPKTEQHKPEYITGSWSN